MNGPAAAALAAAVLLGGALEGAAGHGKEAEARVSLDLREAPVTEIVQLLATLGGFQAVFDPGLQCALTLKVHEVAWRTALEISLRACRLGVDEDADVLRIAPLARLEEEARSRERLNEERRRSPAGRLRLFRLSYARAEALAPQLRELVRPDGRVSVDSRTNTLIVVY